MASLRRWVDGARPRTLPAALTPVLVGTGIAVYQGEARWGRALLAALVALALQVGVNFANDYSDGVRGTDAQRVGPVRLVGQGLASPGSVLAAAMVSFSVAAVAGLVLVLLTASWWLLLVGALAIIAAWTYTGGPRPYGYAGLGELFVFVFFGVVATVGTAYVQLEVVTALAVVLSLGVGLVIVAILVANNLRDLPGDAVAGKRTLAVRLGDARTRRLYMGCVIGAFAVPVVVGVLALLGAGGAGPSSYTVGALEGAPVPNPWPWPWGAFGALLAVPGALAPVRAVRAGANGPDLVPVLVGTGRLTLAYGLALAAGLVLDAAV